MEPTQPTQQTAEQPSEHIPESQVPPAPQSEPQKPKKRSLLKIFFIVIGIFLLIVVLLAAGVFYYLQRQGLTPDKLNPEPIAPRTTIAPKSPTKNIYQNQNYKFSMPIDKDITVKEAPYGFGVTSMELRTENTPPDFGPDFQMLVFPKAIGKAINQDFDKFYSLPDNTTEEVKDPTGAAMNFTKVRNRTISGNRAYEFRSTNIPVDPEAEPEIGVYIEMGEDLLIVSTPELNRAKLEEMLVDFKYQP